MNHSAEDLLAIINNSKDPDKALQIALDTLREHFQKK